jgi:hypothetical protein
MPVEVVFVHPPVPPEDPEALGAARAAEAAGLLVGAAEIRAGRRLPVGVVVVVPRFLRALVHPVNLFHSKVGRVVGDLFEPIRYAFLMVATPATPAAQALRVLKIVYPLRGGHPTQLLSVRVVLQTLHGIRNNGR